jgi:sodium-dependent dicarboxylate transporter 2/3/5
MNTNCDPTEGGRERSPWQRLGLLLGPLLFAAALYAPGLSLDGPQRRAAGVTLWTAAWWITEALPVGAASLTPAVLLPLTGVMEARKVAPFYMSDLVMLFLGAFVVALGLERWGVHRRIALRVLGLAGPDPRRQVLAFMVAAAGLSLWINNTSTTLLMLPIALAVLDRLETRDDEQRRLVGFALLLGIAWSASVGGMGSPVGTAPNQLYLGQLVTLFPDAPEVGFASWMLAWLPLVVLWVPLAWWLLTRVLFPVDAAASSGAALRDALRAERRAQGPMSTPQRRMALVFGATALLWVTRADIRLGSLEVPGWWRLAARVRGVPEEALGQHSRDITDATVAVAMALVCFLLPARGARGERLMDWDSAKRLPWEVLLLLGAGFVLAGAFRESGLDQALGQALGPALEGRSSWVVVGLVALSVSFLTEVTSNTATTAVLLPVIGQAAAAAGLDPRLVMVPTTIAASAAFMLPVATPPNAVVFSSGRVGAPVMARAGVVLNFATVALLTVLFQLWVRRAWSIGATAPDWVQP